MTTDLTISCPHCRRTYTMRVDPERLKRLKTRATCGRCGNTFDAASRIVPPSEATTEPKLPRIDVAPAPVAQLPPAAPPASSGATVPDLRDEMEELAREFAEAAARFTPVRVKRPAAVTAPAAPPASDALEALLPPKPPLVEEPTRPGVLHASLFAAPSVAAPSVAAPSVAAPSVAAPSVAAPSVAAPSAAAPSVAAPSVAAPPVVAPSEAAPSEAAPSEAAAPASEVAAADQLSFEAEPAGEAELATAASAQSLQPPQPQPRAPAAPRSWLELADPGLASLQPPPSPGAAALEALLDESSTIALPSPPAAS